MRLRVAKVYDGLLKDLKSGTKSVSAGGIWGPARGLLASGLSSDLSRPVVLVAETLELAREIYADTALFMPDEDVLLLPDRDLAPYEASPIPPQIAAERLRALPALPGMAEGVVITTASALHESLPPPARLKGFETTIKIGMEADRDSFMMGLVKAGYRRVDMVELPGEFAGRGAVVDVSCPALGGPVRVEFDGDTVISLRWFDPASQRSMEEMDEARFGAAAEAILTDGERRVLLARLPDPLSMRSGQRVAKMRERLETGGSLEGEERYLPWVLGGQTAHLADYFPGGALILECEPAQVESASEQVFARASGAYKELLEMKEPVPAPSELLASPADVRKVLARYQVVGASQFAMSSSGTRHSFSVRPARYGAREFEAFAKNLRRWKEEGVEVVVACASPEETTAISGKLKDLASGGPAMYPRFAEGSLSAGVVLEDAGLVLLPARDVLGAPLRRTPTRRPPKAFRDAFADLKTGEPVVHEEYGIGLYQGVVNLAIEEVRQDFFLLEFANNERIYLPVDQVHRVQKFLGTGTAPKLSHLGTQAWEKTKARVRENLRKFAEGLLKLYAERHVAAAPPFPPLPEGEEEFAASFPYEETEDQERVISEVGRDLEATRPMDRLVCGDVGYGKTEVALRAAFRVAISGAQAAVLVPTTILAEQHYQNFRARLAGTPVRVDMLSRFRSPKERKAVAAGAASGALDIIVGTHHLLSKSMVFKRLGLLVIDEEHRFGVTQKERLKELRRNVHVLTLSATPIPRTLNMGLAGLRDLSIIETPPPGRLSVVTHVLEENLRVAREAIIREMERGGQVFYLHNRVHSIANCAKRLQEAVPEAKLTVAHGQMPEHELERAMGEFMSGKTHVLVCTSIIGAGLDMPNANTLIVERAETFGLADLYQLRGRVGRSPRQAYAYLFFSPRGIPTMDARRRLAAMLEFGELGSGFRLALRDLEIRGAGNLLGPQQHGVMQAVGFDLYARLLDNSVRELKGETVARDVPAQVSLGLESFLPEWWATDGRTKLEVYKRLAACETEQELEKLREELADRLGKEPREVSILYESARVRILATPLGLESVKRSGGQVIFTFRARGDVEAVMRRSKPAGRRSADRTWVLPVPKASDQMMASLQAWLRSVLPQEK